MDAGSGIYILLGILAVLVCNATEKNGRNGTAWTSIAIYFGLIIPAIIVAIMGPNKPTEVVATLPEAASSGRKCPYCAEGIQPDAIKGKHCGEIRNT